MMNSFEKKGFTLLEILVVMAIIAILVGILFPALSGIVENAKKKRAAAEAKSIASAMRSYHALNKAWPMQSDNSDMVFTNGNSAVVQFLVNQQGQNFYEDIVPGQSLADPFRVPYCIVISPLNESVRVWSCGPNGINETLPPPTNNIPGDDIVVSQ